ncbi:MAG TPA: acetyl-CoA carboxylase carboxyltransferase subunit alpha [Candidatus Avoscillospira stercorigallinarum]|uniref:Acetyl-coenzyme A carboxylase carboxyl transferase subunit alpha n=1 Tax=Candidatus Avoscillospira stercorigallinarum TaxID=2840708 RepID=A0A9D1CP07_9FIRM|nr:acetyl-CoA carboxylase carboxyltransferase subunit alpha [Candidatus Avoscillospira stercorigallinarum]
MAEKTGYERVKAARSADRPTGLDYVNYIFTDFVELHGDRRFGDDPAIVGGIARLNGRPVTVIAIEKGHTTRDRMARNFGMPHPEGYRKALRLMQQAEKFHRPVICFVDTAGAYCGIGAEERGQGQAIAENLVAMSGLKTPILSVLIGEGGSGGALALAVADRVWMLENAVYSVISPEGCASILWKDAARAEEAASCLKLTARDALAMGITEEVISEDQLGTPGFYDDLAFKLQESLKELEALTLDQLLDERYNRFRRIGKPE